METFKEKQQTKKIKKSSQNKMDSLQNLRTLLFKRIYERCRLPIFRLIYCIWRYRYITAITRHVTCSCPICLVTRFFTLTTIVVPKYVLLKKKNQTFHGVKLGAISNFLGKFVSCWVLYASHKLWNSSKEKKMEIFYTLVNRVIYTFQFHSVVL